MATAVVMPKQGNTVESCVIVSWKKRPGDPVAEGEPLCEVETDKAVFEVTSPASGSLLARFFEEGADVPVLTNIAVVGAPGEAFEHLRPEGSPAAPASAEARGEAPAAREPERLQGTQRLRISPRARKLAAERGVDPSRLHGSGPGGRIIVRDIEAAETGASEAVARPASAPLAGSAASGARVASDASSATPTRAASTAEDAVTVVPMRGVRKVIADRMLASLRNSAQLTMHASADARRLLELRSRFKESRERKELAGVTVNDLVLYAASRTLPRFPELNALYQDGAIHRYATVHLGFAVDTERGLMVPVIRHAERLGLLALAAEAHRLADACAAGTARPEELSGGTFTVTNLGSLGVESFTPVLNPPQVAILGVCSIALRPVRQGDEVVFVETIGLSLTIDHQVVDGAPAARFLRALAGAIAEIDMMLAS